MNALFLLIAGIIRVVALCGLGAWFVLHLLGPALIGGRLWASDGAFWLLAVAYGLAQAMVWIYLPKVEGQTKTAKD